MEIVDSNGSTSDNFGPEILSKNGQKMVNFGCFTKSGGKNRLYIYLLSRFFYYW